MNVFKNDFNLDLMQQKGGGVLCEVCSQEGMHSQFLVNTSSATKFCVNPWEFAQFPMTALLNFSVMNITGALTRLIFLLSSKFSLKHSLFFSLNALIFKCKMSALENYIQNFQKLTYI